MATRKIETKSELFSYVEEGGFLGMGVLVRDGEGDVWLGYETEADGTYVVRPINEDDANTAQRPLRPFIDSELTDLPLPLYVTTEDHHELASAEAPATTIRTATVHLIDGQQIQSEPKVFTPEDLEQMEGSTDRIGQVVGSREGYVHLELGEGMQAVIPARNISWLEFQDLPEEARR